MKRYSIILIVILFLSTGSLNANETVLDEFEAKIIALSLETSHKNVGYTIVTPKTKIYRMDYSNVEDIKKCKEYIKRELKQKGFKYNISALLDDLFNKNKEPVRINLKSEPSKGYVIDYEGKRKTSDEYGLTTVSRPAYDKDKGIVLIYKGARIAGWFGGAGYIILYKFKDNKLIELSRALVWVS